MSIFLTNPRHVTECQMNQTVLQLPPELGSHPAPQPALLVLCLSLCKAHGTGGVQGPASTILASNFCLRPTRATKSPSRSSWPNSSTNTAALRSRVSVATSSVKIQHPRGVCFIFLFFYPLKT